MWNTPEDLRTSRFSTSGELDEGACPIRASIWLRNMNIAHILQIKSSSGMLFHDAMKII